MTNGGLFSWIWELGGGGCELEKNRKPKHMWVRVSPELFDLEVPGLNPDILKKASEPGGSPEEKLVCVADALRAGARHLEGLQTLLQRRVAEGKATTVDAGAFPKEVQDVIATGTYPESFLRVFDGQSFQLHREEIAPYHEYQLVLEVHSGGAYWSNIPDAQDVRHQAETISALGGAEGAETLTSQWGAGQRGAVFAWRWRHAPGKGPYNLPEWLGRALDAEGDDPLRKLVREQEAVKRWEQQQRQSTAQHMKQDATVENRVLREVLKHWPCEVDAQGEQQLKKCAWIEGVDASLFVGPSVPVKTVLYDESHKFVLHASVAKRHQENDASKDSPPFCLTTAWRWAAGKRAVPVAEALPALAKAPGEVNDAEVRSAATSGSPQTSETAHEKCSTTGSPEPRGSVLRKVVMPGATEVTDANGDGTSTTAAAPTRTSAEASAIYTTAGGPSDGAQLASEGAAVKASPTPSPDCGLRATEDLTEVGPLFKPPRKPSATDYALTDKLSPALDDALAASPSSPVSGSAISVPASASSVSGHKPICSSQGVATGAAATGVLPQAATRPERSHGLDISVDWSGVDDDVAGEKEVLHKESHPDTSEADCSSDHHGVNAEVPREKEVCI